MERFLTAAHGGTTDRAPVWLMRQAGRYLPEYQAVRAGHSFLEMCKTPTLAAEVSLQPWQRYGMDAVIFFCDILIPCEAMGLPLSYTDGAGPRLGPLMHSRDAVATLSIPDPVKTMPFVGETLKRLRAELDGRAALIGFAGAPWTLATYVLAGGSTTRREQVKEILTVNPQLLHDLLNKLTDTTIIYLKNQFDAGAQALQLFDSWAGHLTPEEYAEFGLPYTQRILKALHTDCDAPLTLFCQKAEHLLPLMAQSGADVLSIGEGTSISQARQLAPQVKSFQGNLPPTLLRDGPISAIREATQKMCKDGGTTGFIANLGHGVLKETPPEHVAAFVETVQRS